MKYKILLLVPILSISFSLFWISCTNTKGPQPLDCTVNPVVILSTNTTDADCGQHDGSIQINVNGGSGKYFYSVDGTTFQDSGKFLNLLAGNYNISVKDENDCNATRTAIVGNKSGFSITFITTVSGCGGSAGTITISTSGGIPPFQYKIENQSYQPNNILTGLAGGSYNVLAKDSTGCETIAPAQVFTGISLDKDIMPILATNCAVSGCHDGMSGHPDWTVKSTVISKASVIKQRTSNGTMPPNGLTITNDDKQTIACWVDDGAKNN